MLKGRSFAVLAVVTAIAVAAAVLTRSREGAIPQSGDLLFPDLLARVNEATRIVGLRQGKTFTLDKEKGRWVVDEKSHYPADPEMVHQLLVGAATLRRVEPKTANPKLYPKVGLGDPAKSNTTSVRYTFEKAGGGKIVTFVVGERSASKSDPELDEIFVRTPGDAQSWLVEGKLPRAQGASDWLDKSIVLIDKERIREVRVRHADGEVVDVRKSDPAQNDFELVGTAKSDVDGRQWKVNDVGRFATELQMDDVAPAADVKMKATPDQQAEVTTFDGLRLGIETSKIGGKTYARLTASYDPSLRAEIPPQAKAATSSAKGGTKKGEAKKEPANKAADAQGWDKLHTADAVRAEAKKLERRFKGWAYVLPAYKADYLARRHTDLVKKKEPAKSKAGSQG